MNTATTPVFQLFKTIKVHEDSVNAISFSSDGTYLASGGADQKMFVIDAKNWNVKKKFKMDFDVRALVWHPTASTPSFSFSVNGTISCGGATGVVSTIQLNKNTVVAEYRVSGPINCLAIEKEGKFLAIGCANNVEVARKSAGTWTAGNILIPPPADDGDVVLSINFKTKRFMIVTYMHYGIVGYDFAGGVNKLWRIESDRNGHSSLSPNSRFLATTVMFQGIYWHDVLSGDQRSITVTKQPHETSHGVLLPVIFITNSLVVAGSETGHVSVFRADKPEAIQILDHSGDIIQALAHFRSDRRQVDLLVTGTSDAYEDSVLRVWVARRKQSSGGGPWRWLLLIGSGIAAALVARHRDTVSQSLLEGLSRVQPSQGLFGRNSTPDLDRVQTLVVTRTVEVTVDARPSIIVRQLAYL
ncbi:WD40-repeat-containing domain protein [Mycena leptocephala]|nr:WD40-repeat-containing domain protein [Mycena leptocephala]